MKQRRLFLFFFAIFSIFLHKNHCRFFVVHKNSKHFLFQNFKKIETSEIRSKNFLVRAVIKSICDVTETYCKKELKNTSHDENENHMKRSI